MLHDLGLNLVCNRPFHILGEAEQDRSPPLLHIITLRFWKVVQWVKLLHNYIRSASHSEETLLLIKPCNQGGLIVTPAAPKSPGRLQVCRRCHSHIHGPGRYPKGVFLQLGRLTTRVSKFVILNTYIYSRSTGVCESNLSDDVYDKVTISSITGVILSADLGVFREIAPTRGGAISWNSQIRTGVTPVILLNR